MFNSPVLDKVVVKKKELLAKMEANLEAHIAEVKELRILRNQEAREFFKASLELMDDPAWEVDEEIKFPLPVNNSKAYEQAIKMVEMSVEDEIELTGGQFDNLILDNWGWKTDLLAISGLYKK